MSKIDEAIELIVSLGLPTEQQNERSALTLLALANVRPESSWGSTERPMLRIHDLLGFALSAYGKKYAENSRETFRRQTIHQFEQARIVDRNPDDPTRPTNSGKTVYQLTEDAALVLKSYGTSTFNDSVKEFSDQYGSLKTQYARLRESHQVPLTLSSGQTVYLSPGDHNVLQVAVIEEFGPKFAPGAVVLYVGDTAKKHVVCDTEELQRLGVPITEHDKLPDIILYHRDKNWLFLIEAVTSHGPVSAKRHRELESLLAKSLADRVYVTAFLSSSDFRKYAADIAWETEVWIAANPDHMIHFNGPKFLGPYKPILNKT